MIWIFLPPLGKGEYTAWYFSIWVNQSFKMDSRYITAFLKMQSEAEITSDELRMLPEHTELLIMHWKRIRNALVSVGRTDQISTPLKHSLTASLTLSLCQGPAICYLWRAINVSCITNHTDPIVCVLFSYLCLVEKWLSIPSKQHLLVSHVEDFSPRVVMPMWKHSMSF